MRPSLVPAFALVTALFAASSADAQRRPLPPPPSVQPAASPWFTEPALLTTYVATVLPATLAQATDDPEAILALVGTGYVLGPMAGWYVAGASERGAAWTVVRAAAYGGALWSFAAVDYGEMGPGALPTIVLHGVAAAVVLTIPYAIDVGRLGRHVQRIQARALSVTPVLGGDGTLGARLRLRW